MKRFIWLAVLVWGGTCLAANKQLQVSADGSGEFKTIQEAVAAVAENSTERTIIHIKPGIYQGQMIVPKTKSKVSFEGEDLEKTVITYAFNQNESDPNGSAQFKGTGVVVLADDFRAEKITFQNTSGNHGQAQALRIEGDRAIVMNCRMLGWQDTLLLNAGRQYLKDCYIEGRVDFIYGSGTVVFDHCEIHSKNGGHITAASTPQDHPFGFVFLNCRLTGDSIPWVSTTGPTTKADKVTPLADLGRPWRPYANVAYLNCEIGSHIKPAGWMNWNKTENYKTTRYAEYHCTGPGADRSGRVEWAKELTDEEAARYTIPNVLSGTDHWDPTTDTSEGGK